MEVDIRGYSKVESAPREDRCSIYYDGVNANDYFTDIVKNLEGRYVVDERPACTAQNVCYNIVLDESDNGYNSLNPNVNRGKIQYSYHQSRSLGERRRKSVKFFTTVFFFFS